MADKKARKAKKPMRNKVFAGIWGTILAILAIAVIVGNFFANKYATIISIHFGHETSKTVDLDESGASDYFTSDYASKDELMAHEAEISDQIVSEGSVLMTNEDNALPLAADAKVSLFSNASVKFRYGGNGSGAIDETTTQSLREVMEEAGFSVNPTLWDMYENAGVKQNKEVAIDAYTDEVVKSFADYNDAAIVVISRKAQEAMDMKLEDLQLNDDEKAMLDLVNQNFDKIIILMNTANTLEMGWLEDYENIKACMWVGYAGQTGITGIPKLLNGEVSPSGRLTDTWAANVMSSAAYQNFGYGEIANGTNDVTAKNTYVVYGEGIYVGYRYYETRYEDTVLKQGNADSAAGATDGESWDYSEEVLFPFGHGLSYTSFEYSDMTVTDNGETLTAQVTVTNTGDVAGRDVVEVYMQSPFTDYDKENLVEKASVELVGFDKTQSLEPGASETVSVEIDKEQLAAYDYTNAKTYVVDAGDYLFSVADDAHAALNNILAAKGYTTADGMDAEGNKELTAVYNQAELDNTTYAVDKATGNEITNQFDDGNIRVWDDSYTYLTRTDWEGTWPTFYGEGEEGQRKTITGSDEFVKAAGDSVYQDDPNAVMPTTNSGETPKLITMRGKSYDDAGWDEILDSLSVDEMFQMVRLGGWNTAEIATISKPKSNDQDGPAGISDTLIGTSLGCMGYPNAELLAATWDIDLVHEMGVCIGEDGLSVGVNGWYAPGAGIHRTAFGGRNFEYYSEDGFLSGKITAAEIAGAQSKGMYVYLKHIAMNDQEDRRYGIATFPTEQALREVYLKPFEIAVKDGGCTGFMAAFNSIGTTWCGAHKGLMTNVIQNEWGFHGIVVTDYASANDGYMRIDDGLIAGTDLWLNTDSTVYNIENIENNATLVTALRNSTHDILYTVVNSSTMNGVNENTTIKNVLPLWRIWLILFDAAMAIVVIGGALLIRRRCKKVNALNAKAVTEEKEAAEA